MLIYNCIFRDVNRMKSKRANTTPLEIALRAQRAVALPNARKRVKLATLCLILKIFTLVFSFSFLFEWLRMYEFN